MLWATALSGSDEPTGRHLNLAGLVQVLDLPEARAKEQRIRMDAVLGWPKERERCDVSLVDCRQVLLCCVHQQVRGRFAVHRRPEWTPAFVTHVQGLGVAHLYRDINTTKIIARTKAGDPIMQG